MRKLKTVDIPEAARLLKRIGVKGALLDAMQRVDASEGTTNELHSGFEILWSLFEIATDAGAEKEFYDFLSRPFEMSVEEIENLDLIPLMDAMEQLYTENDLGRFFGFVRKLMT